MCLIPPKTMNPDVFRDFSDLVAATMPPRVVGRFVGPVQTAGDLAGEYVKNYGYPGAAAG